MKSSLGLGLSERVYRLPGADTLPPLEPVANSREGWGTCPEILDSVKNDKRQVGCKAIYLLYLHVCIYGRLRKSGRRGAHALERLQRGILYSVFKEVEYW